MTTVRKKINFVDFITNYRILLMIGGALITSAVFWLNLNFVKLSEYESLEQELNTLQLDFELLKKDIEYMERIFTEKIDSSVSLPSQQ